MWLCSTLTYVTATQTKHETKQKKAVERNAKWFDTRAALLSMIDKRLCGEVIPRGQIEVLAGRLGR